MFASCGEIEKAEVMDDVLEVLDEYPFAVAEAVPDVVDRVHGGAVGDQARRDVVVSARVFSVAVAQQRDVAG